MGKARAMTYKEIVGSENSAQHSEDDPKSALSFALARNLRQLRLKRGISLDRLAKTSRVSRAMLGQIETGKSAPTLNTVGLIAHALKVSISTLLAGEMALTTVFRKAPLRDATSTSGAPSSRIIADWRDLSGAEIHEISLAQGCCQKFAAMREGIKKSIFVVSGALAIEVNDVAPITLSDGEAIIFCADQNHALRTLGPAGAKALLVIAGVDRFNWQNEQSPDVADDARSSPPESELALEDDPRI
jgi:transcriptional regulator with XRE-family HTH domain